MKLNKLALLCGVACAAFAGQASAQLSGNATALGIVNDAQTNNRIVYVSGASAVQGGLNQIASTLFQPGFFYFQSANAGDYRGFAGKLANATANWPVGTNVIFINRAKGGSVQGVNPVARGTAIESINVSSAGCTTGAGTLASPYVCALTTDVTGTATPSIASDNYRVPDAGVSDVAPGLFDGLFNTEGEPAEPALDPSELATLTPTPLYGLAFGVPLTDNLPLIKLNKSVVSAIYAGNVGTWNTVDASLPADDVLICRRVNGSGTQAVANLYFGNYPCDTGSRANTPADRSAGSAWDGVNRFTVEGNTGATNVVENSTSGDVRSCMNAAFDASGAAFVADGLANPGTFNPATRTFSGVVGYTTYVTSDRAGNPVGVALRNGRPHKAVGVLSMDSLSNSTASSKWTFRSLDGAGEILAVNSPATLTSVTEVGTGRHPSKANLVDGTWDLQGWISYNQPSRTTGDVAEVLSQFLAQAQSPAVLAAQTNLKFVAASLPGTPDPTATGNVLRAGYLGGDQCAPLNRNN